MKTFRTLYIATAMLAGTVAIPFSAVAQAVPSATTPSDMTDGEIRKVDKDTKKITIKHGAIKNLDMPGMTMVFQVKDPATLNKVKVGDKVKFRAEKGESGFVVSAIDLAN